MNNAENPQQTHDEGDARPSVLATAALALGLSIGAFGGSLIEPGEPHQGTEEWQFGPGQDLQDQTDGPITSTYAALPARREEEDPAPETRERRGR